MIGEVPAIHGRHWIRPIQQSSFDARRFGHTRAFIPDDYEAIGHENMSETFVIFSELLLRLLSVHRTNFNQCSLIRTKTIEWITLSILFSHSLI
jgi:hypothetical protein